MTVLDERKRMFESQFKREQDLRFRITARRNRLFGEWAARRLGLAGADAEAYARSVVDAQFERSGVIAKVNRDFRAKGVRATELDLHLALVLSSKDARRQVMSGRNSPGSLDR